MKGTRKLHIEESIYVLDPQASGNVLQMDPIPSPSGRKELVSCKYFTLEMIAGRSRSVPIDLQGESFSALTALRGTITVQAGNWSFELSALETLLIPAICGKYQVSFTSEASALISYVTRD
jgi:mannose-6-phosphate isomerase class I